ncbi:hypothetical protein SCOR_14545 [Sulfidibacter corallicola]|uniref:Uncharacterized protein n=1 Tax=Sulfidibacter corallicola TaxID=2818388 RepID=A0A8A4TYA7_SULCO|nr:hypothetical protein [Sulfidibacter corallicola]QTD54317.1 hypothetical protein J3U87_17875 [Sulfidibacter corallicola]
MEFRPINEGNVIEMGPYQYTVPPGVWLAHEEHAQHMYGLLNTDYIDNCHGVFFSASGTWSYGVSIQWYPGDLYRMAPAVTEEQFFQFLGDKDLLPGFPSKGERTVAMPPTTSEDGTSFEVGFRYAPDESNAGEGRVLARKVWISTEGALVYTLMSKGDHYDVHQEEIRGIFDNVVQIRFPDAEAPKQSYTSYLSFFNIPLELTVNTGDQANAGAETLPAGEPQVDWTASALVIGLGVVILVVAFVISRRKPEEA